MRTRLLVILAGLLILQVGADAAPRFQYPAEGFRSKAAVRAWQQRTRAHLAGLLKLPPHTLGGSRENTRKPSARVLKEWSKDGLSFAEMEVNGAYSHRTVILIAEKPKEGKAQHAEKRPAILCLHGHGGDRYSVFDDDPNSPNAAYKAFARRLAEQGFICASIDVGRHEVSDPRFTVMGERLYDAVRAVDYLSSRDDVDAQRIGCAGLSLGGEMAMWLGAMDTRVAAVVSAGFLTVMDQLEQNHCLCWKFQGLRESVDFPEIYGLIAPRRLQCQNGRQEPATQFPVPLAESAFRRIQRIYTDLGAPHVAEWVAHPGGHEIDLDALLRFFSVWLPATEPAPSPTRPPTRP